MAMFFTTRAQREYFWFFLNTGLLICWVAPAARALTFSNRWSFPPTTARHKVGSGTNGPAAAPLSLQHLRRDQLLLPRPMQRFLVGLALISLP